MPDFTASRSAPLADHVRQVIERSHSGDTNLGHTERVASLLGGGALMVYGVDRGTFAGMGLAILGAAMVWRGATGRCGFYRAMGVTTASPRG